MNKINNKFDSYLLYSISGLCILFSLLSLSGLLESNSFIKNRIPSLTLLGIGLILTYLVKNHLKKIENIENSLHEIRDYISNDSIEKLPSLVDDMDDNLKLIFGDYVSETLLNISRVFSHNRIVISDINIFRHFYIRVLRLHVRASFFATSVPSQKFFWKNDSIDESIEDFINKGGKIKRIFFLNSLNELEEPEVKEIMDKQYKIGVKVYFAQLKSVPQRLERFFMVDSKQRIGWEPRRGIDGKILGITATSNKEDLEKYSNLAVELLELDCVKLYKPD